LFSLLGTSGVPSLSCNKVALAAPRDGVLAASLVGVCGLALVITPERVVVPAVRAGLVRALLEGIGVWAGGSLVGEHPSDSRRSNKKVCEGDHFVRLMEVEGWVSLAASCPAFIHTSAGP
jgi:hypothetical protein